MDVGATTGYATLAQVIANAQATKQTIDTLTGQSSTGLISSTYAGLGQGARTTLDLSPQLALNQTAQTNIVAASTIMTTTQDVLGQIEGIAANVSSQLLGAQTDSSQIDTTAAQARDSLTQIANLLDTKVGDVYIFAGQDSNNPPVPNPGSITSSGFFTAIQTAMAALPVNGATATTASTLAVASPGGTQPFSATLLASNQFATVDVGGGARVTVGVLASQNSSAVSAGIGTVSTGSYMSDIMLGLARVGSLSSTQIADPNYMPMIQNTLAGLQGATSAINADIGAVGSRQDVLAAAKTTLTSASAVLTTQVSSVQDVDLAATAAKLSAAQTQLQASYQIIAALDGLSLVHFLPA